MKFTKYFKEIQEVLSGIENSENAGFERGGVWQMLCWASIFSHALFTCQHILTGSMSRLSILPVNYFHHAWNEVMVILQWLFYNMYSHITTSSACCDHEHVAIIITVKRRKPRCSSAICIAFTSVCGPENPCWPWSSTSIIFLTSIMFMDLHIAHRNCEQVKINKEAFFLDFIYLYSDSREHANNCK